MPIGIPLLFLAASLIITALYAGGLLYHWLRFGYMYPWVYVAMPVYLGGTGFFILLMLGALAAI
jgi:hypothetical protein